MATADTIRDLGREMAKRASEQQQADITAAISQGAAMNPDNKTPFQDQNEFLANEVRKIGEASAERARLTSELAREEYDNQVRANILKEKEIANTQQKQTDAVNAQTHGQNVQRGEFLLKQVADLERRLAPYQGQTRDTLPLDLLREATNLGQEWNNFREGAQYLNLPAWDASSLETGIGVQQQVQSQPVQTQPSADNGPAYQITKTDNGVEVRFSTGEIFKGNADEVLDKIARSKAETRRWADGFRSQLQERQQQTQQQPDLGQQYSSISDYWTDQQAEQVSNALAKRYGFSNEQEMVQYFKRNEEIGQTIEDQALASEFYRAHPEFPGTDAASDAMTGIIEANGWQWNINSMEAAHALAVQRGLYQPLTQELIAAANGSSPVQQTRPTPPPMVHHGGNPEIHSQAPDAWSMPLAELRAKAIKDQLTGGQ